MCTYFKTETEDHSIGNILSEKKMGVRGQFLKKTEALLIKEWKQPPVLILQQSNFCNIFILCLQLRIIRQSDQGVQLMNFSSQIFFNDIGYKAALLKKTCLWMLSIYIYVASYCYYEKRRRTNARSLSICILFQLESEDKVFAQEFSCEESDF